MAKSKKHPARGLVVNVVMIGLAFGLLGLVVYQKWDKLRRVFSRPIDSRLLALAFAIYLATIVCTFLRWSMLVRVIEPKFRRKDALLLGFIGNLYNLVIPGGVGGDFVKAAYLVRMDIKRTQAVASMVIDRILGLLGLFLLAGVAGLFAWPLASTKVRALIVAAWIAEVSGLLVLGAIFNQSLTKRYPKLLEGPGRNAGILRELKVMSETYRQRLGLVGGMLGLSSLFHSFFVVAFYLASRAIFHEGLPGFPQHLLIVPLILFTIAVPLPFGALGVVEKVSDELFSLVNHPDGALAMMAFRVLMYGGGLVSLVVYLTHIKEVRGLTEAATELEDELLDGDLDAVDTPPLSGEPVAKSRTESV